MGWSPRKRLPPGGNRKPAARAPDFFYLHGYTETPQSSWVASFGYGIRGTKTGVVVTFKGGARCFYPGTTERDHASLAAASSKGTWVHNNIYRRHYEQV